MKRLLDHILVSFAGPFTVSEAHSLGMSSGTSDVCPHSARTPQRFDPLLGGVASPNFQDMFMGCPRLCPSFFGQKIFKKRPPEIYNNRPTVRLAPQGCQVG